MPCKTEDMLLEGATPAGLVFRWHCGTYLLCRLQNRLWMTAPEYQIYGNRLPVSLGKERTVTICFQPSHTLHDKNKTIKPATNLQEHFFPEKLPWHPVYKHHDNTSRRLHNLQTSYLMVQAPCIGSTPKVKNTATNMQIIDKNVISSLLNICKNTALTTRARVSSALRAGTEDSRILWLMTMPASGWGEDGRLMGMTEFVFPKIQENKQIILQKKSESQKVHNSFICSDARNSSTYYLK